MQVYLLHDKIFKNLRTFIGTAEKEGIEIDFRGELESLICNMFTKDGVSLPMVTIMIEGGMQSIDQAVSTLRKG